MADQVEEVKQKTDIVALISEYLPLKKAGRNYKALCPFHSEKTPSFMVSPELQIFKCFGCQTAGDAFAFLQQYEGMEFGEALRFLAQKAGVKLVPTYGGREASEKEKLLTINALAGKFYQYFLLDHAVGQAALEYLLKDRGLKLATIKEWQLGFSPDNPVILRKFLVEKKKFTPQDVERAGLAYPKDDLLIDRFRGRLIFPLFDHRSNLVGFAGRVLPGAKQDLAKYINTPETALYHKSHLLYGLNLTREAVKKKKTAIVVEGELDAISSWQVGVKNVVAIKGSALTEDQVRLISRFSQNLILALDTDIAGDEAAKRGITIAFNQGLNLKVARLGDYKDPDEAARANPEFYKKALIDSTTVWDFLIDAVFAKFKATTGEGKSKISREVTPILAAISDKIVQAHYLEVVARRLGVSLEAVAEQVVQVTTKKEEKLVPAVAAKREVKDRRALLEERLLKLAFQSDPAILAKKGVISLIKTPLARRIGEEYLKFSQKRKTFSPSAFAEALPKELLEGFAQMVLQMEEELDENPTSLQKEMGIVRGELEILAVKENLKKLGLAIREFEAKPAKEHLKRAKEKFKGLTERLHTLEEAKKQGIILEEEL